MQQRGETIYINFYDEINPAKVKVFMAVCAEIIEKFRPSALYLCLSSPGGHVASGITLHNFLKALPVKVITHNTGSVDSIATMIFFGGSREVCDAEFNVPVPRSTDADLTARVVLYLPTAGDS
jgi:ATP-dependent Clp protease protease subunit